MKVTETFHKSKKTMSKQLLCDIGPHGTNAQGQCLCNGHSIARVDLRTGPWNFASQLSEIPRASAKGQLHCTLKFWVLSWLVWLKASATRNWGELTRIGTMLCHVGKVQCVHWNNQQKDLILLGFWVHWLSPPPPTGCSGVTVGFV